MHDHAPAGIRSGHPRRLLAISLGITATVLVVQVIGAVLTGSLALLADAGHMLTDSSGLIIALIAASVAARPADERHTYGYQRAEVLGALLNAVILIALCVWIGVEAVGRLVAPGEAEVQGLPMLVVAVIGLVANGVSMYLLSAAQRSSINVRGAYLEVLGDLIGSAVVLVAAAVIWLTGWMPADAVASLLIAVLIVPRAITLLREVFAVLGERAPAERRSRTSATTSSVRTVSSTCTTSMCGSSRAALPSSRPTSSSRPNCSRTTKRVVCSHSSRPALRGISMSSTPRSSSSRPVTWSTTRTPDVHRPKRGGGRD